MDQLTFLDGDAMPMIGLGTWLSKKGEVYDAVRIALEAGYRHLDCAPIYRNESGVGRAISDAIKDGVVTREELWVTSKLWNDAHEPRSVKPALERTLDDLSLDYLDLYLMHWPVAFKSGVYNPKSADDLIPLSELPLSVTWEAMEELKENELARHIGVANFSVSKLKDIIAGATVKPEMNQVELHPYLAQEALVEFCHAEHIHVTAYASLGSGHRPDSMRSDDEVSLLNNEVVRDIAMRRGMTPAQVLLRFSIDRKIAVIPKSTNRGHIIQNLQAQNFSLGEEDMKALLVLNADRRYITAEFWDLPGGSYSPSEIWS